MPHRTPRVPAEINQTFVIKHFPFIFSMDTECTTVQDVASQNVEAFCLHTAWRVNKRQRCPPHLPPYTPLENSQQHSLTRTRALSLKIVPVFFTNLKYKVQRHNDDDKYSHTKAHTTVTRVTPTNFQSFCILYTYIFSFIPALFTQS